MQKLYAVLVAIENYPQGISPLKGCANDLRSFSRLLEQYYAQKQPEIIFLQDEFATKQAIIKTLQDTVSKIQSGDSFIFYFTGHGDEEPTDIWQSVESSGKLQGLVCYDSKQTTLLSDKELRFILKDLPADAHNLVVYDACHSGGAVRFDTLYKNAFLNKQPRKWEDFCFGTSLQKPSDKRNLTTLLHSWKINYYAFAACQANEKAQLEFMKGSRFTTILLQVLKQMPQATYEYLQTTLPRRLACFKPSQTPVITMPDNKSNTSIKSLFLGGATDIIEQGIPLYSTEKKEWKLAAGALQGITQKGQQFDIVDKEGMLINKATIKAILLDYSELKIADNLLPNNQPLFLKIPLVLNEPIGLYIQDTETYGKELKKFLENKVNFSIADSPEQATIHILFKKIDTLYTTIWLYDSRRPKLPICEAILFNPYDNLIICFEQVVNTLNAIGKNYRLQTFVNADTRLSKNLLSFELYTADGTTTFRNVNEGCFEIALKDGYFSDKNTISVKLKTTNVSNYDLYVSLFYLSPTMGIVPIWISEGILAPNIAIEVPTDNYLPFTIGYLSKFPADYAVGYIKAIVSTVPFNSNGVAQKELPPPKPEENYKVTRNSPTIDKGAGREEVVLPTEDWTVQTQVIYFKSSS